MTEETIQTEPTAEPTPENQNINISVEQILAAIVATVGTVTVSLETLIANYADKQIAVNQNEDKTITFSLSDAPKDSENAVEPEPIQLSE